MLFKILNLILLMNLYLDDCHAMYGDGAQENDGLQIKSAKSSIDITLVQDDPQIKSAKSSIDITTTQKNSDTCPVKRKRSSTNLETKSEVRLEGKNNLKTVYQITSIQFSFSGADGTASIPQEELFNNVLHAINPNIPLQSITFVSSVSVEDLAPSVTSEEDDGKLAEDSAVNDDTNQQSKVIKKDNLISIKGPIIEAIDERYGIIGDECCGEVSNKSETKKSKENTVSKVVVRSIKRPIIEARDELFGIIAGYELEVQESSDKLKEKHYVSEYSIYASCKWPITESREGLNSKNFY